jgi:hypothetical protein
MSKLKQQKLWMKSVFFVWLQCNVSPLLDRNGTMKWRSDLGKWSKTVGGATCIRNNIHLGIIAPLIHANHKHGSVSWWCRYNYFLGATLKTKQQRPHHFVWYVKVGNFLQIALLKKWYMNLQVCWCFLSSGKNTRRFNNIFSSIVTPRNLSRISGNSEAKNCKFLNTCQNKYAVKFFHAVRAWLFA